MDAMDQTRQTQLPAPARRRRRKITWSVLGARLYSHRQSTSAMRSTSGTDRASAGGVWVQTARRRSSCLVTVMSLLAGSPAAAQASPADSVLAETLFREGKDLMAARQFDAACPKLAESNRLDPGTGTLLALALCHEGEGRIASAWIEFTDVLAATADTRPDRALVAREHIAEVEPALSKLTVIVPAPLAQVPGLEVLRDGIRLDRPAWGTAVPIDGGAHTLEAKAAKHRPWTLYLDIAPTADRRVVEIPVLDPEPGSVGADSEGLTTAPKTSAPDVVRQRWGLALGAVGVLGLATGAYFGVSAISKIHDAKAECPTAPTCTSQAPLSSNSEGLRDATIADVAIGAGLLAGALGVFLVLTGRAHTMAGLRVVPSLDRFGASVTLTHPL
jgi:hypothetical protein